MVARLSDEIRVRARPESGAPPPSEHDLLRAVANGERWAADALYDLLYPNVARTLQKVLHDPRGDYDDLVQTTFERIMSALLGHSSREVMSLTAWASGIAAHVALDSLRKKARERRLVSTDFADAPVALEMAHDTSVEQKLEARNQLGVVRDVLASMKAELAEVVLLHDMVGCDLRETAISIGTTVAAAQSRLVRGRKEFLRRVELRLGKAGRR